MKKLKQNGQNLVKI